MDEKIDSKEQGMSPQMTEKASEREKAFLFCDSTLKSIKPFLNSVKSSKRDHVKNKKMLNSYLENITEFFQGNVSDGVNNLLFSVDELMPSELSNDERDVMGSIFRSSAIIIETVDAIDKTIQETQPCLEGEEDSSSFHINEDEKNIDPSILEDLFRKLEEKESIIEQQLNQINENLKVIQDMQIKLNEKQKEIDNKVMIRNEMEKPHKLQRTVCAIRIKNIVERLYPRMHLNAKSVEKMLSRWDKKLENNEEVPVPGYRQAIYSDSFFDTWVQTVFVQYYVIQHRIRKVDKRSKALPKHSSDDASVLEATIKLYEENGSNNDF